MAHKTTSKKTHASKTTTGNKGSAGKKLQKLTLALAKDPNNEEVFVNLWDVLLDQEDWPGLIALLTQRLTVCNDEREKVRTWTKLAGIYDERLDDQHQAIEAYLEVLKLDPKNQRALWALGMLYHDLEDWEKVIDVYLTRIKLAETSEEKLNLRSQLAQIYEQRLRQEDQALMEYIRAAKLAPQNVRVLFNLEKLATRTESFGELLAVYQDVVERIESRELRIALYLKLARLHQEHFQDREKASEYYRRALSLAGAEPQLLFSISTIYSEEGEWEELIATYTQLISLAESSQAKSLLRREMARLYKDGLRDPASAFFELVRVARYDPSQPGLIDELIELGNTCEKHAELAAVLEDMAERLPDRASKLAQFLRLGRLHLEQWHNFELARQAMTKALDLDPTNLEAQLLRLDWFDANHDFETLALALEAFLSRPGLPARTAAEQQERLANLYEQKLNNPRKAAQWRRSAEKDGAATSVDLGPVPRGFRERDAWEERIDLLCRRMDATVDPEAMCNMALEISEIFEKQLEQPDRAFFELVRMAKKAPGHVPLLDELFRLGRIAGFSSQLQTLAEDLQKGAEPPIVAALLARLGQLFETEGEIERALDKYRQALACDCTEPLAFGSLRAHYLAHSNWKELVRMELDRASRLDDPAEQIEQLLDAAEVLVEKLKDGDRAIGLYQQILALDPTHDEAQEALRLLRPKGTDREVTEPSPKKPAPAMPGGQPGRQPAPKVPTKIAEEVTLVLPRPNLVQQSSAQHTPRPEPDQDGAILDRRDREPTLVELPAFPPKPAQWEISIKKTPDLEAPTTPHQQDKEEDPLRADPSDPHSPPREKEEVLLRTDSAESPKTQTWDEIAAGRQGQSDEAGAFLALEQGVRQATDLGQKTSLLKKMSILAQDTKPRLRLGGLLEELGMDEDAESSYRAVLRSEPAQAEALDGLLRIYDKRDALDRYDAILSRTLKSVTESKSRRALIMRQSELRARRLNRAEEALAGLEQLMGADPENLDVLSRYEELLSQVGRYDDLVLAYRQHLQHVLGSAERVDLFTAMGLLYQHHLDNQEQAIHHYQAALKESPGHFGALDALVSLLEKQRDWLGAIEIIKSSCPHIADPQLRGKMLFHCGKILEEQLLRPEEAEQAYRQASEGEDPWREALGALRGLARRRGDWAEMIRVGNLEITQLESPAQKAQLYVELARVWKERLENEEQARRCFEQACLLDPDNLEAARVVAELRFKDRRHEEAHQLFSRLIEKGAKGELDEEELPLLYLKLAQAAEALGRQEDAKNAFEQAYQLAPTDRQILSQYGYHLSRRGDWEQAVRLYRQVLERYHQRLSPNEVAEIHCLVAQGFSKLAKNEEASVHYRKALKANPKHLPALRNLIDLSGQSGRHQETVELLTRFRDLTPSPAVRWKVSVQLGDILADSMVQPGAAAIAYQEALNDEPNNIELLEKLRKALVRAEKFSKAVEVIERLAHLSPTDRQRSRYFRVAAEICSERLDDDRRSLDYYTKSLRLTPTDPRAHAAAVKILNRLRDWKQMASLYEDLLRRLPPPIGGQEDRRLSILHEMIELYRFRLMEPKRAIVACENLLAIDPAQVKVQEDLARLYEADGRFDQAVAAHRSLIAQSPFSVDSYHALRRIYEQRGQRDRTLCLAATLGFLDEANEDERRLLKEFHHALPLPAGRCVDETGYLRLLVHPQASGLLGEMFGFAADFCRQLFVVDGREYKLKPRDLLHLDDSGSKLAEQINEALHFLGLPAPEVYSRSAHVKGIMAINTSPVSLLYSDETMRKASIPELKFMVGRAIAFSRSENLLAASLSARKLRLLLEGMVELVRPGGPVHPSAAEVADLAHHLDKHIPGRKRERLDVLASRYREQAEDLSIQDWLEGIEHTCNRVGLVMCGDLDAAVSVLKTARVVSPSGSNRSLIRELIFYSISEEYFELRQNLHAAIES